MKTRERILPLASTLAICACAAALLLSGCSTAPLIKTTLVKPGLGSPAAKAVSVYRSDQKAPASHEIVGVVTALPAIHGMMYIAGEAPANVKHMQAAASAMGADALIGYRREVEKMSRENWSTAIAVRTVPDGTAAPPRLVKCFVAVPHALIPAEVSAGSKGKKDDSILRLLAQSCLVAKGYYAQAVEAQLPESFEAGLNAMNPEDLAKFGGEQFDLILAARLVSSAGVAGGIATVHQAGLELSLYSKSQRKVVWTSAGKGAYGSLGLAFGIGEWFLPSSKRAAAMNEAMKAAFAGLEDVSTQTIK